MGNKFSRAPKAPAEAAPTEQKVAEEPVPTPQAAAPQSQEAVVAAAPVSEPAPEPVPEPAPEAPAASAPLVDLAPEPVAAEAPAQPEPEPEPPVVEPEPIPEPEPVVEPEPVREPTPEPEPVVEPEPVPEPIPEPVVEPEPVPTLEQEIDLLTQESLPEPFISSAPLVDLGVPDFTTQLIDTPPSPTAANPEEPADIPGECPGIDEAVVNSMPVPEEPKESWESLEKSLEPESVGAENMEQLLCDVISEPTESELLKHLDLNDRVSDLIPNDIKIPDDIPIADMNTSSELM